MIVMIIMIIVPIMIMILTIMIIMIVTTTMIMIMIIIIMTIMISMIITIIAIMIRRMFGRLGAVQAAGSGVQATSSRACGQFKQKLLQSQRPQRPFGVGKLSTSVSERAATYRLVTTAHSRGRRGGGPSMSDVEHAT